jgi:hypothetical protein
VWTYSDVKRAILERLGACDLLTAYRALRAAEIEGAERELLRRLLVKFSANEAPAQAPVLLCPRGPRTTAGVRKSSEQSSLF